MLIGWILLSFLAAWIANEKGRGTGWVFLISLALSPIVGIILALALQRRDPAAPKPGTHRRCPDCQEWILRSARKCKHCGSVFADALAGEILCPYCAKPNAAHRTHCAFCQAHLRATG